MCLVIQSCPTLCDPMSCSLWGSSVHGDSPGKNTGVGSLSLLRRIFPTQGSNPGLLHCRWILYQLSCEGSPRILKCIAYAFSKGSSQPRNKTGISCIEGGFFTSWATREAQIKSNSIHFFFNCTFSSLKTLQNIGDWPLEGKILEKSFRMKFSTDTKLYLVLAFKAFYFYRLVQVTA